jgi:molybdate transport system permease protein
VRGSLIRSDSVLKYTTLVVLALLISIFASPLVALWRRGFSVESANFNSLVDSLLLSLVTSLLSTALIFVFSVPVAYTLSRLRATVKRLVETVTTIPVMVSPSAIGSLLLLFFAENPVGSAINKSMGVLNDPKGVIAAQFIIGYPVALSLYTAIFSSTPRVYEEVALEAGLSRLEYLYRVLLPMTRNQVLSGLVLVYARVFADFGASLVVGGGIRGKTWTFPIYIYMTTQYGDLVALSIALLLYLAVAVALLYTLYTIREVASGFT